MKRILAMLLAAVMLLPLAACGGAGTEPTEQAAARSSARARRIRGTTRSGRRIRTDCTL